MNENETTEAINQLYMTVLGKYEAVRDDHDALRKRYTDLIASHSAAVNKLELSQVSIAKNANIYIGEV